MKPFGASRTRYAALLENRKTKFYNQLQGSGGKLRRRVGLALTLRVMSLQTDEHPVRVKVDDLQMTIGFFEHVPERSSKRGGSSLDTERRLRMRISHLASLLVACMFFAGSIALYGQAAPTSEKSGDLQAGVGYIRANADYSPLRFNGFAIFADVDFWKHLGAEAEFHRVSVAKDVSISETTYEVGGRYRYPIGRFSPYLKLMVGEGSFAFETHGQNGTYGMYAGGGGIDYRIQRRIIIRADYEYQRWSSFPPRGLQPSLSTIGVAYSFK